MLNYFALEWIKKKILLLSIKSQRVNLIPSIKVEERQCYYLLYDTHQSSS